MASVPEKLDDSFVLVADEPEADGSNDEENKKTTDSPPPLSPPRDEHGTGGQIEDLTASTSTDSSIVKVDHLDAITPSNSPPSLPGDLTPLELSPPELIPLGSSSESSSEGTNKARSPVRQARETSMMTERAWLGLKGKQKKGQAVGNHDNGGEEPPSASTTKKTGHEEGLGPPGSSSDTSDKESGLSGAHDGTDEEEEDQDGPQDALSSIPEPVLSGSSWLLPDKPETRTPSSSPESINEDAETSAQVSGYPPGPATSSLPVSESLWLGSNKRKNHTDAATPTGNLVNLEDPGSPSPPPTAKPIPKETNWFGASNKGTARRAPGFAFQTPRRLSLPTVHRIGSPEEAETSSDQDDDEGEETVIIRRRDISQSTSEGYVSSPAPSDIDGPFPIRVHHGSAYKEAELGLGPRIEGNGGADDRADGSDDEATVKVERGSHVPRIVVSPASEASAASKIPETKDNASQESSFFQHHPETSDTIIHDASSPGSLDLSESKQSNGQMTQPNQTPTLISPPINTGNESPYLHPLVSPLSTKAQAPSTNESLSTLEMSELSPDASSTYQNQVVHTTPPEILPPPKREISPLELSPSFPVKASKISKKKRTTSKSSRTAPAIVTKPQTSKHSLSHSSRASSIAVATTETQRVRAKNDVPKAVSEKDSYPRAPKPRTYPWNLSTNHSSTLLLEDPPLIPYEPWPPKLPATERMNHIFNQQSLRTAIMANIEALLEFHLDKLSSLGRDPTKFAEIGKKLQKDKSYFLRAMKDVFVTLEGRWCVDWQLELAGVEDDGQGKNKSSLGPGFSRLQLLKSLGLPKETIKKYFCNILQGIQTIVSTCGKGFHDDVFRYCTAWEETQMIEMQRMAALWGWTMFEEREGYPSLGYAERFAKMDKEFGIGDFGGENDDDAKSDITMIKVDPGIDRAAAGRVARYTREELDRLQAAAELLERDRLKAAARSAAQGMDFGNL